MAKLILTIFLVIIGYTHLLNEVNTTVRATASYLAEEPNDMQERNGWLEKGEQEVEFLSASIRLFYVSVNAARTLSPAAHANHHPLSGFTDGPFTPPEILSA